jgi:hypothetical protein
MKGEGHASRSKFLPFDLQFKNLKWIYYDPIHSKWQKDPGGR